MIPAAQLVTWVAMFVMNTGGKPLVGISACLLGENVRYDGRNKRDRNIMETLGKLVDFIAICPEVESGMGVPREAMQLVDIDGQLRLVTLYTVTDRTAHMQAWMQHKLAALSEVPLCGYIFKARSPSCGLLTVPCRRQDTGAETFVSGMYARGFADRFPGLPVADEEQLRTPQFRDEFLERVFRAQRRIGGVNL